SRGVPAPSGLLEHALERARRQRLLAVLVRLRFESGRLVERRGKRGLLGRRIRSAPTSCPRAHRARVHGRHRASLPERQTRLAQRQEARPTFGREAGGSTVAVVRRTHEKVLSRGPGGITWRAKLPFGDAPPTSSGILAEPCRRTWTSCARSTRQWGRGGFSASDWADPEIESGWADGPAPRLPNRSGSHG